MKQLDPTQAHEIAGGRRTGDLVDGPTFPPYQVEPMPDAEPLPASSP